MGKIKQGILGGFNGKVGPVIGFAWKGISGMRARAQSVPNPNTEAQQLQRKKFRLLGQWLSPVNGFLRAGFAAYADGQSQFDAAMDFNFAGDAFSDPEELDRVKVNPASVIVSKGALMPVFNATAAYRSQNHDINITWDDNTGIGNAKETDTVMWLLVNETNGQVIYHVEASKRDEEESNVDLPTAWHDTRVGVWIALRNEAGLASDSQYLGAIAIE